MNNKILEYKGYNGTVDVSIEDNCLFGKVLGVQASITYEGNTLDELREDFKNGVDDYLEYCKDKNIKPQQPFTGIFNVRLNSELHRKAALRAKKQNISLNSFIKQAVTHELER